MNLDKGTYHSLSKLLTSTTVNSIINRNDFSLLIPKILKYKRVLSLRKKTTVAELFQKIYLHLDLNYKYEYIYKNTLLNKLIEEKKLDTTTLLNEIRIGKSKADLALINGEPVLYEIKTELDNSDKLIKQLGDYQKAFKKIYIVTHYSIYYKYYLLVKDTSVGLIYLDENNNLIIQKECQSYDIYLDHSTLFRLLRKNEYTEIVKYYFGKTPQVPNTQYFKACYEQIKLIPINEFYLLTYKTLKERKIKELNSLYSDNTPKELKYICYTLNLNKNQYNTLYCILQSPLNA